MAYKGQSGQHFINFNALSFAMVEVVIVSGSGPNFCGHSLLRVDGFYFHILGWHNYPKYMTQLQFSRYMKENEKIELFRTRRFLQNKEAAMNNLRLLLKTRWSYGLFVYNCLTFVEEIISTGEDNIDMILNCPTLLRAKIIRDSMSWYAIKVVK